MKPLDSADLENLRLLGRAELGPPTRSSMPGHSPLLKLRLPLRRTLVSAVICLKLNPKAIIVQAENEQVVNTYMEKSNPFELELTEMAKSRTKYPTNTK